MAGLTGYEYSVNSTDGEDGTWVAATATPGGGEPSTIGDASAEHAGIQNGLDHTYWVRASDPDGTAATTWRGDIHNGRPMANRHGSGGSGFGS